MRSCSAIDKATNFPEQTPAIICRVSAYRNTQWLYHCYDKTETVIFLFYPRKSGAFKPTNASYPNSNISWYFFFKLPQTVAY